MIGIVIGFVVYSICITVAYFALLFENDKEIRRLLRRVDNLYYEKRDEQRLLKKYKNMLQLVGSSIVTTAYDRARAAGMESPVENATLADMAFHDIVDTYHLTCDMPPHGWECGLPAFHDGPCPATSYLEEDDLDRAIKAEGE